MKVLRVLKPPRVEGKQIPPEDTGQLTSCFNESEGRRYRSTYFVF